MNLWILINNLPKKTRQKHFITYWTQNSANKKNFRKIFSVLRNLFFNQHSNIDGCLRIIYENIIANFCFFCCFFFVTNYWWQEIVRCLGIKCKPSPFWKMLRKGKKKGMHDEILWGGVTLLHTIKYGCNRRTPISFRVSNLEPNFEAFSVFFCLFLLFIIFYLIFSNAPHVTGNLISLS